MNKSSKNESLGWISGSTVTPKASRPIKVSSTSAMHLKAALFEQEEMLKHGKRRSQADVRNRRSKREKIPLDILRRDRIQSERSENQKSTQTSNLLEKVKRYNALSRSKVISDDSLVDFQFKHEQTDDSNQKLTKTRLSDLFPIDKEMLAITVTDDPLVWEEIARISLGPSLFTRIKEFNPNTSILASKPPRSLTKLENNILGNCLRDISTARGLYLEFISKRLSNR